VLPLLHKARCRGASYTYKVSEFKEQWHKFIRKRGGVEGGECVVVYGQKFPIIFNYFYQHF
jgi:hypothetical protein